MPLAIEESRVQNHHAHFDGATQCQLTEANEAAFVNGCLLELRTHLCDFPSNHLMMRKFIREISKRNGIPICPRKIWDLAGRLLNSKTYVHN